MAKLTITQTSALAEEVRKVTLAKMSLYNRTLETKEKDLTLKKLQLKENGTLREFAEWDSKDYRSNGYPFKSCIVSFMKEKYKTEFEKLGTRKDIYHEFLNVDSIKRKLILQTIDSTVDLQEMIENMSKELFDQETLKTTTLYKV